MTLVQYMYRHLIPARVDRTSASVWLNNHPWITCQRNEPSTSMTEVACKPKLRLVLRSSTEIWVAIIRAVVYFGTFSCEVIYAYMPRKLGGNRACDRVLCYPPI